MLERPSFIQQTMKHYESSQPNFHFLCLPNKSTVYVHVCNFAVQVCGEEWYEFTDPWPTSPVFPLRIARITTSLSFNPQKVVAPDDLENNLLSG